jgi:hypothetical protein
VGQRERLEKMDDSLGRAKEYKKNIYNKIS